MSEQCMATTPCQYQVRMWQNAHAPIVLSLPGTSYGNCTMSIERSWRLELYQYFLWYYNMPVNGLWRIGNVTCTYLLPSWAYINAMPLQQCCICFANLWGYCRMKGAFNWQEED